MLSYPCMFSCGMLRAKLALYNVMDRDRCRREFQLTSRIQPSTLVLVPDSAVVTELCHGLKVQRFLMRETQTCDKPKQKISRGRATQDFTILSEMLSSFVDHGSALRHL